MQKNQYQDASNPENNVWVSASAGSGKTKLLVDRFLRLIMSGENLEDILCITFTNAAANEMHERVKTILKQWFTLEEGELKKELLDLNIETSQENLSRAKSFIFEFLDKTHKVRISTIHSICQEILSCFPLESESKISTRIIDDSEKDLLIQETKNLLFETDFTNTENLRALFENISQFNISQIIDSSLSFESLSFEWSNIEDNIEDMKSRIDQIFKSTKEEDITIKQKIVIKSLRSIQENYIDLSEEIDLIKKIKEAQDISSVNFEIIQTCKSIFFTLDDKPRSKLIKKALMEKYPELHKDLLETQRLLEDFFEIYCNSKLNKISKGLCEIKAIYDSIYKKVKYQNSCYDFNDIINKTFSLLSNAELREWVKYKYGKNLKHILVDESQDTNISQWKIITTIFADAISEQDSSLFIVGDEKQSIYSFQGASPQIFLGMKNIYQEQLKYFDKNLSEISLQKSFRSSHLLLDFVDKVFCKICRDNPTTISSAPKHEAFFDFQSSYIEIFPSIKPKEDKEKISTWQIPITKGDADTAFKQNARLILDKIKYLISQGYLKSDILILIRKRDDFSNYLSKKLKEENIDINSSDKTKLNQHIIIKDIIAFAEFVTYPYDDLNLASLLKSYFFEFTEQELLDLCYKREQSLWERLKNCTKPKSLETKQILEEYLNSTITYNIYDFFFDLLIGKKYKEKFYYRAGKEAEEVIQSFLSICKKYQEKNKKGLTDFIDFIRASNVEMKFDASTDADEVRMMTVHGSKGLQSEIVILAETVSSPKMSDNLFWDQDNNIPIFNGGGKYISEQYKEIKSSYKNKLLDEYYRLLYVAMTRAKTQLYCFGHSAKQLSDKSWYSYIMSTASNYFSKREFSESEKNSIGGDFDPLEQEVLFYGNFVSKNKISTKIHNNDFIKLPLAKTKTPQILLEIGQDTNDQDSAKVKKLGIFVHKFFELTINKDLHEKSYLQNILRKLAIHYGVNISKSLSEKIISCHMKISEKIAHCTSLKKEQEIVHKKNSNYHKVIIDLLIEYEDKIVIADYKMSNFNDDNRNKYIEQLSEYREILQKIYPNKKIECCIIWVADANFDFI